MLHFHFQNHLVFIIKGTKGIHSHFIYLKNIWRNISFIIVYIETNRRDGKKKGVSVSEVLGTNDR